MSSNLQKVLFDIAKTEALLYAIESAGSCVSPKEDNIEDFDRAVYTFYALWDEIMKMKDDINALAADSKTVDIIYASMCVNDCTLKTE